MDCVFFVRREKTQYLIENSLVFNRMFICASLYISFVFISLHSMCQHIEFDKCCSVANEFFIVFLRTAASQQNIFPEC